MARTLTIATMSDVGSPSDYARWLEQQQRLARVLGSIAALSAPHISAMLRRQDQRFLMRRTRAWRTARPVGEAEQAFNEAGRLFGVASERLQDNYSELFGPSARKAARDEGRAWSWQ